MQMPIDPQEDPPIKPGQPSEPPRESPPGNPRPEVPPPLQDPGEPSRPEELPGRTPDELPVRGPQGPSTPHLRPISEALACQPRGLILALTTRICRRGHAGDTVKVRLKPSAECVMNNGA
jgi:hypothetical protein